MKLPFTRHAWDRYYERLPWLNIGKEWDKAKTPSKRQIKRIRDSRATSGKERYKLGPNGVLFVLSPDGWVITMFEMKEG